MGTYAALLQHLQQPANLTGFINQNRAQSAIAPTGAAAPQAPQMGMPQQSGGQQGGGMLDGQISNALSNAYTGQVAQTTGLPWLAGGGGADATSALLSFLLA